MDKHRTCVMVLRQGAVNSSDNHYFWDWHWAGQTRSAIILQQNACILPRRRFAPQLRRLNVWILLDVRSVDVWTPHPHALPFLLLNLSKVNNICLLFSYNSTPVKAAVVKLKGKGLLECNKRKEQGQKRKTGNNWRQWLWLFDKLI